MANYETVVLMARDFFGEPLPRADLRLYQKGVLKHKTDFKNGRVEIRVPLQLKPGVYEAVATRYSDMPDEPKSEYRINDLLIPFTSHYAQHARTHSDLKLEDGNLEGPLSPWKFSSELSALISSIPEDALEDLERITLQNGNPDRIAYFNAVGGRFLYMNRPFYAGPDEIVIAAGGAVVAGTLHKWPLTNLTVPNDEGRYRLGIFEDKLDISPGYPDLKFATVYRDAGDWVRMDVDLPVHPLIDDEPVFFVGQGDASTILEAGTSTGETVDGGHLDGKIYTLSRSSERTTSFSFSATGNGPMVSFGSFSLEATSGHFLLWERGVLVTSLPRYEGSRIMANWEGGLFVESSGSDGRATWFSQIPLAPLPLVFLEGSASERKAVNILPSNEYPGWYRIAGHRGLDVSNLNERKDWVGSNAPGSTMDSEGLADDIRGLVRFDYARPSVSLTGALEGILWRQSTPALVSETMEPQDYETYLGMDADSVSTGDVTDTGARLHWQALESSLGRDHAISRSVVDFGASFTDARDLATYRDATPLYIWEPTTALPSDVAAGDYDQVIGEAAVYLANTGSFFIAFAPVPNHYSSSWASYNSNGTTRPSTPAHYKEAWKRVRAIFQGGSVALINSRLAQLGLVPLDDTVTLSNDVSFGDDTHVLAKVAGAVWVWSVVFKSSPNVEGNRPDRYYPGHDQVDWVATQLSSENGSFQSQFEDLEYLYHQHSRIRATKPFMLERWRMDTDNLDFLQEVFGWVEGRPKVKAMVYENKGAYTLSSKDEARERYRLYVMGQDRYQSSIK